MTTNTTFNPNSEAQSGSSTTLVGSTSALIGELIQAYLQVSTLNSALSYVDTVMQSHVAREQSSDIKQAAEQQAKSTICHAIGGFVMGGMDLVGGVASFGMGYMNDASSQLDALKGYKGATEDALKNPAEIKASTASESLEKAKKTLGIDDRMKELTKATEYDKANLKADAETMKLADPNDVKALDKHLDEMIEETKKSQMGQHKNQEQLMLVTRGAGQVGNAIAGTQAAGHDTKKGIYEGDSSLDGATLSMIQAGAAQASKMSNEYMEYISQVLQLLGQIGEADVFRG